MDIPTIDFETTDKDAKIAKAVEVAIYSQFHAIESFIDPGCPIPPETSAIHQISNDDVKGAPEWPVIKQRIRDFINAQPRKIFCAHNAEYEKGVLGPEFADIEWICTYKCALRVWPTLSSYKNEAIRYHFNFEGCGRQADQMPHSAMHDCKVTHIILHMLLKEHDLETLLKWSKEPKQLPTMPFGKHAGAKWSMIPLDYLNWICRQGPDFDADVQYLAAEERRRRQNATSRSG